MLIQQIAAKFIESLLHISERKSVEIHQLQHRPSKICILKFTLNLVKHLELNPELLLVALLIAKNAIDKNLKVQKKNLYRLMTICLILAEKLYEEDPNPLQAYSLLTGITIKDLVQLEIKMMMHLDYRLFVEESDYNHLVQGDFENISYKTTKPNQ